MTVLIARKGQSTIEMSDEEFARKRASGELPEGDICLDLRGHYDAWKRAIARGEEPPEPKITFSTSQKVHMELTGNHYQKPMSKRERARARARRFNN